MPATFTIKRRSEGLTPEQRKALRKKVEAVRVKMRAGNADRVAELGAVTISREELRLFAEQSLQAKSGKVVTKQWKGPSRVLSPLQRLQVVR